MSTYTYEDFVSELDSIEDEEWKRIRFYSDIVRKMIEGRINKGITQAQLAEKTGLSQAAISRFESYDHEPKLATIRRIADALELELDVREKATRKRAKLYAYPKSKQAQYLPNRFEVKGEYVLKYGA